MPKRPGTILVHSQPDLEDGAIAVIEELQARGHAPLVLCEDVQATRRRAAALGMRNLRALGKNTLRGRLRYLTAATVVTTHGVFGTHRPPRGQVVANIWHGEPLTKAVGRWDGRPPTPSTFATTLSELGKAFRCAEFDLDPAQVLVAGAARNDRLVRAERQRVRAALGVAAGEPLFLWLPTYRAATTTGRVDGDASGDFVPFEPGALDAVESWLAERGATVIAKPHPLAPKPPAGRFERLRLVDDAWFQERGLTLYEVLAGADCLLTDASSVWIDFLLTGRPLICAFPDSGAYRRSRPLHLEPYESWFPGPTVRTGAELVAAMRRVADGDDPFAAQREDTLARLHRHRDDRSTARLLDALGL